MSANQEGRFRESEQGPDHVRTLHTEGYYDGPRPTISARTSCSCGWVGEIHTDSPGRARIAAGLDWDRHVGIPDWRLDPDAPREAWYRTQ